MGYVNCVDMETVRRRGVALGKTDAPLMSRPTPRTFEVFERRFTDPGPTRATYTISGYIGARRTNLCRSRIEEDPARAVLSCNSMSLG